eukprot:TRINITY_DN7623_c0_g1_i1.p1 TRINITY_DN7623_c0_g1~~TRINITY_DN7623_c0_g1_i1.p1  ORF type:complete len:255 (+),score=64.23 TRINITY_DN7623_c0_g1_i1:268-1032(+)
MEPLDVEQALEQISAALVSTHQLAAVANKCVPEMDQALRLSGPRTMRDPTNTASMILRKVKMCVQKAQAEEALANLAAIACVRMLSSSEATSEQAVLAEKGSLECNSMLLEARLSQQTVQQKYTLALAQADAHFVGKAVARQAAAAAPSSAGSVESGQCSQDGELPGSEVRQMEESSRAREREFTRSSAHNCVQLNLGRCNAPPVYTRSPKGSFMVGGESIAADGMLHGQQTEPIGTHNQPVTVEEQCNLCLLM